MINNNAFPAFHEMSIYTILDDLDDYVLYFTVHVTVLSKNSSKN